VVKPGAGLEATESVPGKRFGTITKFFGSQKEKVSDVTKI
jgi:hypothetical protein